MKIGIIEDNQQIGEVLQCGLQISGNEVVLYKNAEECLKTIFEAWFNGDEVPDILVSDLDLGKGISGEEMIKILRLFIRSTELPILIMSGKSIAELNLVNQDLFDARILQKPVTALSLLNEIKREISLKNWYNPR